MVQAGSVEQANTVGLFLTGSDGYDNTTGLLLIGGARHILLFYNLFYYIFFYGIGFRFIYVTWTTGPSILNITNVTVTIQMFLSRSRSLKIKKKCSWTSYNNLASRSGPYWSLYFTDCAMENTLSFFNTSAKMNFASSDCSATIFMFNSLSWLYFLCCRSKKMISKQESVNHFVELLTDINEIEIIHTNLSAYSDFPPM